jgi:hypothetical protein
MFIHLIDRSLLLQTLRILMLIPNVLLPPVLSTRLKSQAQYLHLYPVYMLTYHKISVYSCLPKHRESRGNRT